MKKSFRWVFPILYLLICIGVFRFLYMFTTVDQTMQYISWNSMSRIEEDGSLTPFGMDTYSDSGPDQAVGTSWQFTASLPEDLGNGNLIFEISGEDLSLSVNGTEIYRSSSLFPEGSTGMSQVQIPVSAGISGELMMNCTILDADNRMFPPLIRFIPEGMSLAEPIAYANHYSFPAGIAALALLLTAGLFLLGAMQGHAEWSLIPLSVALFGLMTFRLVQSCGYYFLPENINRLLTWQGCQWLAPLALLIYLAMNRRRNFWKLLGIAAAWSGAGLLSAYLVSLAAGWYLASYLNGEFSALIQFGVYDGLLYWFTLWLAVVSFIISAYRIMRAFIQQRSETRALALKNQLIMDSYHAIEEKVQDGAGFRHEIRHQLTALNLLFQSGKYREMGDLLDHLLKQESVLFQTKYTDNFVVNAILQDASSRAAKAGISFFAQVYLPAQLPLPECDLCMLLMNLLENALEAGAQVKESKDRFIRFKAGIKNGFLTIKCENRYAGELRRDEKGQLITTKTEHRESHGLGLRQMSAVAERYHSILDISCPEDHIFVVRTALQLPAGKRTD